MDRVACACVGVSLWTCRRAFITDRFLMPRHSLLFESFILSARVSRALWAAMCLASCLGVVVASQHCLSFLGVIGLSFLLLDRYVIAPHLLHFVLFALAPSQAPLFSVCLYLFGGLQKLNRRFARGFLSNTLGAALAMCGVEEVPSVPVLGYAAAASEALLGVMLLIAPSSGLVRAAAVLLHVVILVFIAGPLGPGGFEGIIGWNVFCLSWHVHQWAAGGAVLLWTPLSLLTIGLFFVTPALNMLTGWGERIAFKLHSQNNARFDFLLPSHVPYLGIDDSYLTRVPRLFDADVPGLSGTHVRLLLSAWALEECYLMTPLSVRTVASLARHLRRVLGQPVLVFRVDLESGKRTCVYREAIKSAQS